MSHCITRDFLDAVKEDLLYVFHGTVSSRIGVSARTRSESMTCHVLFQYFQYCFNHSTIRSVKSVTCFLQHLRRRCKRKWVPGGMAHSIPHLEKSNHLVVYDPWHKYGIFGWILEQWTQPWKMTLWNTRCIDQMDRWGCQVCCLFAQPFYSELHLCKQTSKGDTQLTCISYELWHVDPPQFHNPSG